MLANFVSPYDATATTRLRAAGAVLFGRLNCDEFAMGSSNENSAFHPRFESVGFDARARRLLGWKCGGVGSR
jgi:hypothetical protein